MEKLNIQEMCGRRVPLKCDNFVLAQIQEKYNTLNNFEMKLLGLSIAEIDGVIQKDKNGKTQFLKSEPSLAAINFALPLMITEGMEYAKDVGEQIEPFNIKKFMREMVMDMDELANIVHEEFTNAFSVKN